MDALQLIRRNRQCTAAASAKYIHTGLQVWQNNAPQQKQEAVLLQRDHVASSLSTTKRNIPFEKVYNQKMTFEYIQGHCSC